MKKQSYFYFTSIIFLVVGVIHFLKIFVGFKIEIFNISYPVWLSWVEMIIAFPLSFYGFKLARLK